MFKKAFCLRHTQSSTKRFFMWYYGNIFRKEIKRKEKIMKLEFFDGVEFYVSKDDKRQIFAEYVIPAFGKASSDIRKFVGIDSPDFEAYLRMFILPESDDDLCVGDILQYIKDYHRIYGNKDTVTPHVRTAGKLKDGVVEYSYSRNNKR